MSLDLVNDRFDANEHLKREIVNDESHDIPPEVMGPEAGSLPGRSPPPKAQKA